MNEKYCNNCGKRGHISRYSNEPITSYGVLLIKDTDDPKIIMIQRKDSLCYIEIIRGKYDIYDTKKIRILLDRITNEELNNIKNENFDVLWKKLWLLDDIKETKYMKEYNYSKNKFEQLQIDIEINDYIKGKISKYESSEWEFPKGKKNRGEKNFKCAMRELEEETNIKNTDYELIENISPIIETFLGENNIKYRNIYYIGICNNTENINIDSNNMDQINEIRDIKIVNKKEAVDLIREYNTTKYKILDYIFDFVEKHNNDFILK